MGLGHVHRRGTLFPDPLTRAEGEPRPVVPVNDGIMLNEPDLGLVY
jgi:hypothetical protein